MFHKLSILKQFKGTNFRQQILNLQKQQKSPLRDETRNVAHLTVVVREITQFAIYKSQITQCICNLKQMPNNNVQHDYLSEKYQIWLLTEVFFILFSGRKPRLYLSFIITECKSNFYTGFTVSQISSILMLLNKYDIIMIYYNNNDKSQRI